MSPEDTHLTSLLHRYKHDASRGSHISPEYEAYYKAHKAAEIAFKKKTTLVNWYMAEFEKTHKLEGAAAKSDLAMLVLNVWQTVVVQDSLASVPTPDTSTNGTAAPPGRSSTDAAQKEAGRWFFERYGQRPPLAKPRRRHPAGFGGTWGFDDLPGMRNAQRDREAEVFVIE